MNGGTLDLDGNFVQVASLAGANVTIIDSSGGGTLQLESDSTLGDLTMDGGTLDLDGNSMTVGLLSSTIYGRLDHQRQQPTSHKHAVRRSRQQRGRIMAAFRMAAVVASCDLRVRQRRTGRLGE